MCGLSLRFCCCRACLESTAILPGRRPARAIERDCPLLCVSSTPGVYPHPVGAQLPLFRHATRLPSRAAEAIELNIPLLCVLCELRALCVNSYSFDLSPSPPMKDPA